MHITKQKSACIKKNMYIFNYRCIQPTETCIFTNINIQTIKNIYILACIKKNMHNISLLNNYAY